METGSHQFYGRGADSYMAEAAFRSVRGLMAWEPAAIVMRQRRQRATPPTRGPLLFRGTAAQGRFWLGNSSSDDVVEGSNISWSGEERTVRRGALPSARQRVRRLGPSGKKQSCQNWDACGGLHSPGASSGPNVT